MASRAPKGEFSVGTAGRFYEQPDVGSTAGDGHHGILLICGGGVRRVACSGVWPAPACGGGVWWWRAAVACGGPTVRGRGGVWGSWLDGGEAVRSAVGWAGVECGGGLGRLNDSGGRAGECSGYGLYSAR